MDQRVYLRLENGDIVALEESEVSGSTFVVQNGDSDDLSQVVQETALQSTSYVIDSSGLQNQTSSVENVSGHEGYVEETTLGNIENTGSEKVVYIVQHEGGKTGDMQYAVVGESGSIDTAYAVQTVDPSRTDKPMQYTDINNVQNLSGIETLSQVASQEYAGSIKTIGARQSIVGEEQVDDGLQNKIERNNDENISLSFYCQHCAETFEDLAKFRQHLKSEHDLDDFEEVSDVENEYSLFSTCEICSQTFLDVKDLEEHKKIHDKEIVSATMVELNQENDGKQVVRKENFKCRHCDKVFDDKSMLLEHLASEHPDKRLQDQNKSSSFTKCPYCHKMYVLRGSNKSMMKHIYTAHPGKSVEVMSTLADKEDEFDEQVKCPLCGLGFYWQKSLVRHIKDQHPKVFEENGNEIFAELGIFDLKAPKRRHRRSLKDDDDEAPVNCTICSKKFLWEKSLRKHMVFHHNVSDSTSQSKKGPSVFNCPYCDLVSRYACAVRKHMERKHPDKVKGLNVSKLHVPTIQAESVTGMELKTIDKRPVEVRLNYCRAIFRCPFCSYASNQSSNLIRHLTSVKHGNIFSQEELKAIRISSFKVKQKYVNDGDDENDEEENLDGTLIKRLPKLKMSSKLYNIVMNKIDIMKQQKMEVKENLFQKIAGDDDDFSDMDIDNIINVAEDESEESFNEDEENVKQTQKKRRTRNVKSNDEKVDRKNEDSDVQKEMEITNDEVSLNRKEIQNKTQPANVQVNDNENKKEQKSGKNIDNSVLDNEMEENTSVGNDLETYVDISTNEDRNKGEAKSGARIIPIVTVGKKKVFPQGKDITITTRNPGKESADLKKSVSCDVCVKEFSSFTEFKKHLPSHVNIKVILRCMECENEFSLVKDLKNHLKKEHKQSVSDVDIRSVQNSYVQMNGKPVTTYDCPYCEMLFSQSSSLQQHILMDHCDCIKTACIKQESGVTLRHKNSETVILALNCQFCECFFHNLNDIVKHMHIVHKYVDRSSVNIDSSVRKSGRKRKVPKWLEEASDILSPAKKIKDKNDGNEILICSSKKDTPLSKPKSKVPIKLTDNKAYESSKERNEQIEANEEDTVDVGKGKKGINTKSLFKTDAAVTKLSTTNSDNSGSNIGKKVPQKSEWQISKLPKNRMSKVNLNYSVEFQDDTENQNKCPHCDFVARRSSALAFHINIKHSDLIRKDSEEKPSILLEKTSKKTKMEDLKNISRWKPGIEIKRMKNNQSGASDARKEERKGNGNDENAQGVKKVRTNIEILNTNDVMKNKIDSRALLNEIEEIENERSIDGDDDYDIEFGDSDDDYKPEKDDYNDDEDESDEFDDVDEGYSVSESLECPYCKTGLFVKFSLLQSHVKKRHPSKASSFSIADVKSHVELDGTIKSSNLVHTCKYCKKSFSSRSHVRDHVKTKHSKKVAEAREKLAMKTIDNNAEYYKCIFCSMLSNYRESVMSHISREHSLERDVNLDEIVRHIFTDSDVIQIFFKCPHCDYKSRWKQSIFKHVDKSHSDIKETSIEVMCEKQLVSCDREIKYQCVYCKWQYERKSAVLTHITETHPDQPSVTEEDIPVVDIADEVNGNFQCPYCELKSKYKNCVSRHISRVHGNNNGFTDDVIYLSSKKTRNTAVEGLVYMCPYCDFDSKWRHCIVRHMNMNHPDVLNLDSEAIPSEYRLKSIVNLDENNEDDKMKIDKDAHYFKCPYCDSVSKSKKGVVEHTVKYHPKKPKVEQKQVEVAVWEERDTTSKDTLYKCQACDSGSKLKKSVVLHMLTAHPEINKFHVNLCKAEFSKKEEAVDSTLICQLCYELFTSTRAITAHCQYIHPNEEKVVVESIPSSEGLVNVFRCLYCDHQSGWRQAIMKHTELHHPEIEDFQAKDVICKIVRKAELEGTGGYQCPFCDTVNHWKKSIIRHMKTVHPKEDQNTPIHFNRLASMNLGGRSSRKSSKQVKCLRCKITCRSMEKMKRHFLSKHPKLAKNYLNKENTEIVYDSFAGRKLDFKCVVCSAKYVWKKSLLVHMKNRHGDMYHVYQALDNVLDIVAAGTDGLGVSRQQNSSLQQIPSKERVIKKDAVAETRRQCVKCHMTFNSQWDVNVHRQLKHRKCPKNRFPCGKCSLSFPTLLLRLQHNITYHKRQVHRPMLQCTIAGCNFRCKFHKILQNHYSCKHNLKIPILGNTTFSTYDAAGSVRCEICLRNFNNKEVLKQHVDLHKKQRPVRFQCGTCGEQFQNASLRDSHIEKFHFDKLEMCDICGNLYTRANLKKHLKIHDEDQSSYVTCQYCEQGVSTKMFNRHVLEKHQDIMNCQCGICTLGEVMPGQKCYQCSVCKQAFCQKPMVYIHGKLNHADMRKSKVFTCDACPQYFLSKRMKESHCHEHHKQKLPVQNPATSVSQSTSTFHNSDPSTHVIHIGQDEGKQYLPKLSEASLNAVIKELLLFEKGAENPYKCLLCGRSFTKAKYIKLHIRRAHVRDEDQPYRCKVCGSGFVRLTEFRKHSRSHSDFRPYKCRYCDKAFKQQANLRDHYRVHTNSKEFKCHFCHTEFRQRGGLTSHVVFHDTLKPFKCMYCQKGFTTRGELSRHMQKYNKDSMDAVEKSYPCHICEETFPHYPMLLKHIDSHNPEKPFQCFVCNNKFANYVAMYFHKVKEEHFLQEEIQEGVKDLQKRGRKFRAKKKSMKALGPEIVYKTNHPTTETIYVSQQETLSEGDAGIKPVEVIIDNFDQEQVVRVQENEPEHEELLSIAKQLTELSGFAESEFYTTKKNVHQEEDEIIRTMLDADDEVLANLSKQSIVIKESVSGRERVGRTEEVGEQRDIDDEDYDYMPEIENDSSTAINTEGTKYVIQEDGHIRLASKSIPTNMEELVSLVSQNASSDNNEQLVAYQSEDGSVIYVCLNDDQSIKTEEVVAEGTTNEFDEVGNDSETVIQDSMRIGLNMEPNETTGHLYEETKEKGLTETQGVVCTLPAESVNHESEPDTGSIIHIHAFEEQTGTNQSPRTELTSNQIELANGNELIESAEIEHLTPNEIQMSNFVSNGQNIHVTNEQQIFVTNNLENTSVEDMQNSNFNLAESNFENTVITIHPKDTISTETPEEDLIRRSQLAKHLTGNIETSRNETRIYTTEHGLQSIGNEDNLIAHTITESVNIPEYIVAIPATASTESYSKTNIASTQVAVSDSSNFDDATINRASDSFVEGEDTLVEYQIDESQFIKEELLDADYAEMKEKDQEVMFFSDNIYTYSHQEKKFICLHCGAKIASFKNLKNHIRRHAPSSARIHNCTYCSKRFVTKNELKRHLYTHTGERNYECKECGKKFIQPGHLQEHMRLHTGDKPFKCSSCSAAFVTKTQLVLHWSRLHSDNEISCDKCDKVYKTHVDLRRHKGLEHSGIKLRSQVVKEEGGDHVCDICGQSFHKKATLKRHLEKHNLESIDESERVEERFECSECGMSFKSKYYVKEHFKMVHTEEKNEICELCGEGFKTKPLLRRHKDNKHPEEGNDKWYCKICKKSLGSKYAYGYHMGAKH